MGGNALKNHNVVRLNAIDYHLLKTELLTKLYQKLPDNDWIVIPSYNNKESFGDIDILYSGNISFKVLLSIFKKNIYIKNGPVISIAYDYYGKLFQVDLIRIPEKYQEFALRYFSFNDLSNIMGRIFRALGLKLAHDGLRYTLRNPDNSNHIIKQLLITTDWNFVIELGNFPNYFDYEFNELEDVFRYVSESKYFNKDIFLLENRNHISRTRDRKRTTYMKFLLWINNTPNLPNFGWSNKSNIREETLELCLEQFPEFKKEYYGALERHQYIQKLKEKYNGNLIGEWTRLEGKELGTFIKYLGMIIEERYIEHNSIEDIKILVQKLYIDYLRKGN